jgi:hypothetical protein
VHEPPYETLCVWLGSTSSIINAHIPALCTGRNFLPSTHARRQVQNYFSWSPGANCSNWKREEREQVGERQGEGSEKVFERESERGRSLPLFQDLSRLHILSEDNYCELRG